MKLDPRALIPGTVVCSANGSSAASVAAVEEGSRRAIMVRVKANEHDACLRACVRIREQIDHGERIAAGADADLIALNLVAAAFACKAKVTPKAWRRAGEAVAAAQVGGFPLG
jgi:hypothetical protein